MTRKTTTLLVLSLILIFVSACSSEPELTAEDLAADFELYNLDKELTTLAHTHDQVRLVYFYFSTCNDVCQPTTHYLSKLQEALKEEGIFGTEASIIQITFDPEVDTFERLEEFSGFYNADHTGWHFLRGEEQYSRDLALEYGVGVYDIGGGQYAHQNIFNLVDQDGYVRKYYNANDLDSLEMSEIIKDIKGLIK